MSQDVQKASLMKPQSGRTIRRFFEERGSSSKDFAPSRFDPSTSANYRPPRIKAGQSDGLKKQSRVPHAKLWIVNLVESSIPENELVRYEKGEAKAAKLIKDSDRFEIENFHWSREPRIAKDLEDGDWFVQVIKYKDQRTLVHPPGQFRSLDQYTRANDKKRWVFHLEVPKRGERMEWKAFQKRAKSALGSIASASPRTKPIRDIRAADLVLSLWTPAGRISRK